MINPNLVSAVQDDSIASPNALRIEFSDMDVLDHDIADTVDHTQTLATNDFSTASADNRLVGGHFDALNSRLVVGTGRGRIITAPAGRIQVDSILVRAAAGVGIGNAALALTALAPSSNLCIRSTNLVNGAQTSHHIHGAGTMNICKIIDFES
ncbi:hypothetical protein N7523_006492 [Penicillium sp. IBT 18751x]|nr:hypothetical protein N7523_006492 [Penicillium sp. IBT 18751x]